MIMKKIAGVIIIGLLMVGLCGCGKSEAVKNVEQMINEIGTVSFDSEEKIIASEEAYNLLTPEEKNQVKNYNTLIEAKEKYDALGIKLTMDNYEKYLNISCSRNLSGGMSYGRAMGMGKDVGGSVYTSIESSLSVSGKSDNYDYNDVVVIAKISGYYIAFSQDDMKNINKGNTTLEEYYKSHMEPIDITLTADTDILGKGSDSSILKIPGDKWVMDTSVEIGYEIIDISGTMTPVR